jgi:hypothetical protein
MGTCSSNAFFTHRMTLKYTKFYFISFYQVNKWNRRLQLGFFDKVYCKNTCYMFRLVKVIVRNKTRRDSQIWWRSSNVLSRLLEKCFSFQTCLLKYFAVARRKKNLRNNLKFNLSKPTGYVMHQQFNIQQLYTLPTLYLCVLYLSENK